MTALTLKKLLIVFSGTSVVVVGALAALTFRQTPVALAETAGKSTASERPSDSPILDMVVLPESKLAAANLTIEPVRLGQFTHSHTVPGRLTYNDNRHIEIRTPTTGVLTDVLVKPGDQVEAGQVLAWLTSPEIGSARADVLKRLADQQLAENLLERADSLHRNVVATVRSLRAREVFETLREEAVGRLLGDYREKLLNGYSRLLLADSLAKSSESLGSSGAVSGRALLERRNEQQAAEAALEALCEQSELDSSLARGRAAIEAQDAARRVQIARQHLASLLLSRAATDRNEEMPDESDMGASDTDLERLSRVEVHAPFSGTIERRSFSRAERVASGDSLFVLADTRSLWIEAAIRENDWSAVSISPGQTIHAIAPALRDRDLTATVYFIGREVNEESNSIPIVAEIDNADGQLRPGLFVRVTIPVEVTSGILTVPERAVLQHDGQSFVFVPEKSNAFRRVTVTTGESGDGRIAITSGLEAEQPIVVNGAFVLKSELLLESEDN